MHAPNAWYLKWNMHASRHAKSTNKKSFALISMTKRIQQYCYGSQQQCVALCVCVYFFSCVFSLSLLSLVSFSYFSRNYFNCMVVLWNSTDCCRGAIQTVSLYSLIGGPKAWICQQTTRCICVCGCLSILRCCSWFFAFFILFLHTMKNEHIRNFKAMHTLKYGTKYSTKYSTWLYYHELCN